MKKLILLLAALLAACTTQIPVPAPVEDVATDVAVGATAIAGAQATPSASAEPAPANFAAVFGMDPAALATAMAARISGSWSINQETDCTVMIANYQVYNYKWIAMSAPLEVMRACAIQFQNSVAATGQFVPIYMIGDWTYGQVTDLPNEKNWPIYTYLTVKRSSPEGTAQVILGALGLLK